MRVLLKLSLLLLPMNAFAANYSAAEVDVVLTANRPQIRKCFESFFQRSASDHSKVDSSFTLERGGKVISARSVFNDLSDDALRSCVEGRLQSLKYPAFSNVETVTLKRSFVFSRKELGLSKKPVQNP